MGHTVTTQKSQDLHRNHTWVPRCTMDSQDPFWNPSIHTAIQGPNLDTLDQYWNPRIHLPSSNPSIYPEIARSTLVSQGSHWHKILTSISGLTLESQDPHCNFRFHTRIQRSTIQSKDPHWYTTNYTGIPISTLET